MSISDIVRKVMDEARETDNKDFFEKDLTSFYSTKGRYNKIVLNDENLAMQARLNGKGKTSRICFVENDRAVYESLQLYNKSKNEIRKKELKKRLRKELGNNLWNLLNFYEGTLNNHKGKRGQNSSNDHIFNMHYELIRDSFRIALRYYDPDPSFDSYYDKATAGLRVKAVRQITIIYAALVRLNVKKESILERIAELTYVPEQMSLIGDRMEELEDIGEKTDAIEKKISELKRYAAEKANPIVKAIQEYESNAAQQNSGKLRLTG